MTGGSVQTDIVIAGAGPAGAAAAIALKKLGFDCLVISQPRPFFAVEGLSIRTLSMLRVAGLAQAAQSVSTPTIRQACWNGSWSRNNQEYLTARPTFDAALQRDMVDFGIPLRHGRINHIEDEHIEDGEALVHVRGSDEQGSPYDVRGRFFVDARGRAAPRYGVQKNAAPRTTALYRSWRQAHNQALTAVAAFKDGWAWAAFDGSGSGIVQIFVASGAALPGKADLAAFYGAKLADCPEIAALIVECEPAGAVYAREATAACVANPVGGRRIRVGDAALAADPLSGHGIRTAVSLALSAAPVINTLLTKPASRPAAEKYYTAGVRSRFLHQSRAGRDFYRLETRWQDHPFWADRSAWPDEEPLQNAPDAAPVICRRGVSDHGLIVEADVVVTAQYPDGIWVVDGVPLADLWRSLENAADVGRDPGSRLDVLARRFGVQRQNVIQALAWLKEQGAIPGAFIR